MALLATRRQPGQPVGIKAGNLRNVDSYLAIESYCVASLVSQFVGQSGSYIVSCMYVYVYNYTYIYIYVYIYNYAERERERFPTWKPRILVGFDSF